MTSATSIMGILTWGLGLNRGWEVWIAERSLSRCGPDHHWPVTVSAAVVSPARRWDKPLLWLAEASAFSLPAWESWGKFGFWGSYCFHHQKVGNLSLQDQFILPGRLQHGIHSLLNSSVHCWAPRIGFAWLNRKGALIWEVAEVGRGGFNPN